MSDYKYQPDVDTLRMEKSSFEKLTAKQQLFVTEYISDLNATRAAREAKYASPEAAGQKLLITPRVKRAIDDVINPILNGNRLTTEKITEQLANFLYRSIKDFCDKDGYLITNPKLLPDAVAQCIEGWETEILTEYNPETFERVPIGQKIKVKLVNKSKMIELAMKYRGLVQGNTQIQNNLIMVAGQASDPAALWDHFYKAGATDTVDAIDSKIKTIENLRPAAS
jgi:phage terminase small subunit